MNRIAAATGAFNAFGSISCMLIVKRIWTCHIEFALYKLIIIIIIIITESDQPRAKPRLRIAKPNHFLKTVSNPRLANRIVYVRPRLEFKKIAPMCLSPLYL